MKDEKFMGNLQKLIEDRKSGVEKVVVPKMNESTGHAGKDYLAMLSNALYTGKPNEVVSKINDIAVVSESLGVDKANPTTVVKKKASPLLTSRANNRDDDDAVYDEQVRQRMAKAAAKLTETVSKPKLPTMSEDVMYPQQARREEGGMFINEQQLFELAQKAVNSAVANLYAKEKIREAILEEKKEIKKIVYETLQELKKMNEEKKVGKK